MSEVTLKQLLEAGVHFGHQVRRWNPKMDRYIYTARGGVHVFDLEKTKAGLDSACDFLANVVKNGGKVMFIGTKRQAADIVKREAERVAMPSMCVRWIGGLMTNWNQLSKRVNLLSDMKQKRKDGEYKKYTKYEQLQLDRQIAKLQKSLGGVADLKALPEALFVVDTHHEAVAVAEANRLGIPVVGIVDTNGDPDMVDYVIAGNDDANGSLEILITAIADAIVGAKLNNENLESKQEEKKPKVQSMKAEQVLEVKEEKPKAKSPKPKAVKKTKE